MNLKNFLFATLSILLTIYFVSCKKDNAVPDNTLANTTWSGTFVVKGNGPDPVTLKFGTGNGITLFFGDQNAPAEHQCKGHYTFVGGKLSFTVTDYYNEKMSFTGTLGNAAISGTWGHGDANNGEGTFNVAKKQM